MKLSMTVNVESVTGYFVLIAYIVALFLLTLLYCFLVTFISSLTDILHHFQQLPWNKFSGSNTKSDKSDSTRLLVHFNVLCILASELIPRRVFGLNDNGVRCEPPMKVKSVKNLHNKLN